jgi:uncharacterized protein
MDFEGTYTLQAAPEEVWACLMDQQTPQSSIPGIERLERLGEETYAFTIHIKHAPLRGSYSGHATVVEQHYPFSYRMTVEGEGQTGKLRGEWLIELRAYNENTVIAYRGNLHLSKAGALLPEPLVKGTIKILIQQFFTALADQLRTTTSRSFSSAPEDTQAGAELEKINSGHANVSLYPEQVTPMHRVVRWLRLGDKDPVLEEQWATRLRRIGMASVLLLLVWIGTRLPRKPGAHGVTRP